MYFLFLKKKNHFQIERKIICLECKENDSQRIECLNATFVCWHLKFWHFKIRFGCTHSEEQQRQTYSCVCYTLLLLLKILTHKATQCTMQTNTKALLSFTFSFCLARSLAEWVVLVSIFLCMREKELKMAARQPRLSNYSPKSILSLTQMRCAHRTENKCMRALLL